MVGFRSTDAYSNAVIDNWLMIPGTADIGTRIMGALCEYNSTTAVVDVDDVLGGIGASVTRTATGLYTIVYESPGKTVLLPYVSVSDPAHKGIVYEFTDTGAKVKTLSFAVSWSLADIPFCLYVVGR